MLVPAINEKFGVETALKIRSYSDDYYFFLGVTGLANIELVDSDPDTFQWVSTSIQSVGDEEVKICTGLFSYKVDFRTRSVYNISLISFDKNNIAFIKDVYDKFHELMETFDRIEWKCISGNPVERHYDRLIKKYGGQKLVLHKCVIDNYGKIHDSIIYEIMTKQNEKEAISV